MPPLPLWIDCDPGIDDAVAVLLALASPSLELRGVSTVAGNVSVETTTDNARRIAALAQRPELPIFAGCPRPLVRSPVIADQVHGANGLGGLTLAAPAVSREARHGVDALRETLRQATAPITLATLGPLTNLAVALIQSPELGDRIARIVAMGGAVGAGNVTSSAEFNFFADPHAAQVVLHSGIPLTLITLDTTHQAIATPARRQSLRELNNPIATIVATLLDNYGRREQQQLGFAGPPLHDPCVIAYLLQPTLFKTESVGVTLEINSPLTQGRLIIDRQGTLGLPGQIDLVCAIDADGFYRLLTEALQRYSLHPGDRGCEA